MKNWLIDSGSIIDGKIESTCIVVLQKYKNETYFIMEELWREKNKKFVCLSRTDSYTSPTQASYLSHFISGRSISLVVAKWDILI